MSTESGKGLWSSLKRGLYRTSAKLSEGIKEIFGSGKKVDKSTLKELSDLLISTDMGQEMASLFTQKISEMQFADPVDVHVKQKLAEEIEARLSAVSKNISITHSPQVILLCGVNGSGKTTTVAKLAHKFQKSGLSVLIGACDTFRAAAVEQLVHWAGILNCPIVSGPLGADSASVAYKALSQAIEDKIDVVLIDTAGRLHNHKNLMEELSKVCRVIGRHDSTAPHDIILVLDATIGQNTFTQVETFSTFVKATGIILTKLDGTAKGGIVLRIAHKYNLALHAIGVGEKIDDLEDFSAHEFAKNLLGIR